MNATSRTDLNVELIDFEDRYAGDFARLNYWWLEKYFEVEPHDREMLDAPHEYIIQPGGQIYFAQYNNKIVGTAALIVENEETFELAKMGVMPEYQGLKIGRRLIEYGINQAIRAGMKYLVLESNTKLEPAIALYKKTGFVEVPSTGCSPYARCNIRMKLAL